ncbi:MAG: thioredoxin family protein [Gemmatimonadaceae bacterium]|nr:thioredoxin family protein [Gemmatimonadaceae bacterium]
MSKKSRERARTAKASAVPKIITTVGIVAIIVAAVVAANTLNRRTSAAADAASVPPPVTLANTATNAAANNTANAPAAGRQLLFFMNPDGYPCQVQQQILNDVADSLSKVAHVVYIKTTEPADMQKFEAYGIRALPSLVIADQNGRELERFAPGIQSANAVLAALSK